MCLHASATHSTIWAPRRAPVPLAPLPQRQRYFQEIPPAIDDLLCREQALLKALKDKIAELNAETSAQRLDLVYQLGERFSVFREQRLHELGKEPSEKALLVKLFGKKKSQLYKYCNIYYGFPRAWADEDPAKARIEVIAVIAESHFDAWLKYRLWQFRRRESCNKEHLKALCEVLEQWLKGRDTEAPVPSEDEIDGFLSRHYAELVGAEVVPRRARRLAGLLEPLTDEELRGAIEHPEMSGQRPRLRVALSSEARRTNRSGPSGPVEDEAAGAEGSSVVKDAGTKQETGVHDSSVVKDAGTDEAAAKVAPDPGQTGGAGAGDSGAANNAGTDGKDEDGGEDEGKDEDEDQDEEQADESNWLDQVTDAVKAVMTDDELEQLQDRLVLTLHGKLPWELVSLVRAASDRMKEVPERVREYLAYWFKQVCQHNPEVRWLYVFDFFTAARLRDLDLLLLSVPEPSAPGLKLALERARARWPVPGMPVLVLPEGASLEDTWEQRVRYRFQVFQVLLDRWYARGGQVSVEFAAMLFETAFYLKTELDRLARLLPPEEDSG